MLLSSRYYIRLDQVCLLYDDSFQDNTDTFDQNVARMELQFTTLLTDLLHKISELGHANYDSHMLTLTNR